MEPQIYLDYTLYLWRDFNYHKHYLLYATHPIASSCGLSTSIHINSKPILLLLSYLIKRMALIPKSFNRFPVNGSYSFNWNTPH